MKFIKNQGVSFILNAILSILIIVSIILYAVNKSLPYFTEATVSGPIIWFLVISLLIVLANIGIRFTALKDNRIVNIVLNVLLVAVSFFMIGAAMYFISDRVYYYGIALGSDLESGNPVARSSCINAIVATAFMLVTGILSVVSNFFGRKEA